MLLSDFYKIPTATALGVIAALLIISVIASLVRPQKADVVPSPPGSPEEEENLPFPRESEDKS
jgi:hypothetical protein